MRKKIPYIELLPILIIGLVLFKLLDRVDDVMGVILYILTVLQPVFWAIGISYVLNPMVKFFERKFKLKRILSIILCYIIVLGMISALFTIVIPMVANNVKDLLDNFDTYSSRVTEYFNKHVIASKWYKDFELSKFFNIDNITNNFGDIPNLLNGVLNGTFDFVVAFFGGLFKIVVGFIIAIYLLMDKEKFQLGWKKIFYGTFPEKGADKTMLFLDDVNKIFSRYIIGKTIDSTIIGILCFIGLVILNAKYAALLAIIVGITNMIPYFGPFIGMIPAGILTLFYSPIKAIWVVLFILGLQQFDGYFLGPKILGDSVGLSPFWIILGILVGGSLMGVLGMLLAVPIVAVLQLIFTRIIDRRLAKKNLFIE